MTDSKFQICIRINIVYFFGFKCLFTAYFIQYLIFIAFCRIDLQKNDIEKGSNGNLQGQSDSSNGREILYQHPLFPDFQNFSPDHFNDHFMTDSSL